MINNERILPLLYDMRSDKWQRTSGRKRWIPLDRILGQPWSAFRLDRSLRKLDAGMKAPAIRVTGYKLPNGRTYYIVSDGLHRTAARRQRGYNTIFADIAGYAYVNPALYGLYRSIIETIVLFRITHEGLQHVDHVTAEEAEEIISLGVRGGVKRYEHLVADSRLTVCIDL